MATEAERTQIAVLQNDMKQVKADISELKTKQAAGFASLEAKFEAQDKKYASKWVQQVVGGLIALILISVVTALLALVIIPATKKPQQQASSSTTTTVNNPSGTGFSGSSGTPSTTSTATAHSDAANPAASQTDTGGVQVTLPKVP